MQLTQQIRIEPTREQEEVLNFLSDRCRLIYNFALKERREAYEQGIKGINYRKQQNDLPKLKQQYLEYSYVYSKVLQYTLRTLNADYKSFFALIKIDNTARPPKFKGRKYFTTMTHNQSGFKVGKGVIELSHKHPSKLKLSFKIPEKFTFRKVYQVSIYKKDNDFFVSVVYDKEAPEYRDNGIYQAFDLGATKHTAVNLSGKFIDFKNQRPDKYWDNPLAEIQSRRDHCKKFSNRWHKLNHIYNKLKRKSANQMKDFQHKLSRKIIDNTKANTIIVGDLSVKAMCKINKYQKGLHKSMHNTGNIARFVSFLTYKAELVGKKVIENDERGTTKTCCVCGRRREMPLYERTYRCECGLVIDRDRNSSVNQMVRFLSQNALWTGYQQFADNLRQTGIDIVLLRSQETITSNKDLGYV